jgi:signal transduction histidine kinase
VRGERSLERLRLETAIPKLLQTFDRHKTVAYVGVRDPDGDVVAEARGEPASETLLRKRALSLRGGVYELRVEINVDEVRAIQRRGRTLPIIIGVALVLAGGVVMAFVFRAQESYLARERELRQRAEQDRRLTSLGQLTAGVAHEIKNPLNAIRLAVARLKRRAGRADPSGRAEPSDRADGGDATILDALETSVASVTQVVEDFMKLARDPAPAFEECAPDAVLRDAVDQVRPMAAEMGRAVDVALGEGAGTPVRLDAARMREALVKLLRNALQASRARIVACVGREGGTVRFSIDDDDPGVPPE